MNVSTRKRYSGTVLPYMEALSEGVIEQPIAGLVESLNIAGVCGTRASCAGHGWPWVTLYRPFVSFACQMEWAAEISKLLASNIETKIFHHCWILTAHFLKDEGLLWALELSDSRSYLSHKKLGRDLLTLESQIRLLAAKFQQRVIASDERICEEGNDAQDNQVLKPLRFRDFSKGIGITTFGTTIG